MPNHPNASAASYAAGAATLLVWALHSLGVELSIYYAGLLVGAAATLVLFVGRRGLKNALKAVWDGSRTVWNGKPTE